MPLSSAASAIEPNISPRRPRFSETAPAQKIAIARPPVASDSGSELAAALTPKLRANSGSSGCTQYSSEKVAKPARNRARRMRAIGSGSSAPQATSQAGAWRAPRPGVEGRDMAVAWKEG